ncbi:MAG: AsnC family protein [Gammaproteobacteria bacterium HGW-Gammaproteobacteria-3]|nr:MAG: AsnC family protein [Gammaproteobacteria bacterium HGW-Gammaproteobacteria-3]
MIDDRDQKLLEAVQKGLPLCSRPYATLGQSIAMPEAEVISRLTRLKQQGLIKRLGVIVKHKRLGYRANAMVVWNIPDTDVKNLGQQISRFDFVTLCYQRPRHLPEWPYNLFCMIHGKDRNIVLEQLRFMTETCGLTHYERDILFSRRCFKQCGALYKTPASQVLAYG